MEQKFKQQKVEMIKLLNIRKIIRFFRTAWAVPLLIAAWYHNIRKIEANKVITMPGLLNNILILPCDYFSLIGSKGDEAMLSVIIEWARRVNKNIEITIGAASLDASNVAIRLGCTPLRLWHNKTNIKQFVSLLVNYDAVIVIGADILDGYYSPYNALQLWLLADIAARLGLRSIILGCSFNTKPSCYLRLPLNLLDQRVEVNLRDSMSLYRFQHFCRAKCRLVADAAFMLTPEFDTNAVESIETWVKSIRNKHQILIGYNIHPLLIKGITTEQINDLVQVSARAIAQLMDTYQAVCVLFIPHDYRGSEGDETCLVPIYELLYSQFNNRVFLPTEQLSAAELKAVAGLVDFVITGRMHLAIAALGQGIPVGGITYQDKFQGLFLHFDLPSWLLLDPLKLQNGNSLYEMMERLLMEQKALATLVKRELPRVLELSERNFS